MRVFFIITSAECLVDLGLFKEADSKFKMISELHHTPFVKSQFYIGMAKFKFQLFMTQIAKHELQLFKESVLSIPWCIPEFVARAKPSKREKAIQSLAEYLKEALNYSFLYGTPHESAIISHKLMLIEFFKTYLFQSLTRNPVNELIFNMEIPKCLYNYRKYGTSQCEISKETFALKENGEIEDASVWRRSFESVSDNIPEGLIVCMLNFDAKGGDLYLSRIETGKKVIFKLPLTRLATRQGETDGLTYHDVMEEFAGIMKMNKQTTTDARCTTKQSRRKWLDSRIALDLQLKDLLTRIENVWLAGFKGLLSAMAFVGPNVDEALDSFKAKIENILFNSICKRFSATPIRLSFDVDLFKMILRMGADPGYDEIEDFLYYLLDAYQYQGVPVIHDEIDIDTMAEEISDTIKDFFANLKRSGSSVSYEARHVVLILDKYGQTLPWESLPIMRGRSVSRLPTFAFLQDRMSISNRVVLKSCFYLLNPSGDLARTEEEFKSLLEQ